MVSMPLVVLTLSALAVHGKELNTDIPKIRPGCEGKTLCDIKPDDYPQDEIDNFFVTNPEYLKHLKKEGHYNLNKELEAGSVEGNCVTKVLVLKPFEVTDESKLPLTVVQSQYFSQEIQEVICAESPKSKKGDYQCFKALLENLVNGTECRPVTRRQKIIVFDREKNEMLEKPSVITVDCVCRVI